MQNDDKQSEIDAARAALEAVLEEAEQHLLPTLIAPWAALGADGDPESAQTYASDFSKRLAVSLARISLIARDGLPGAAKKNTGNLEFTIESWGISDEVSARKPPPDLASQ